MTTTCPKCGGDEVAPIVPAAIGTANLVCGSCQHEWIGATPLGLALLGIKGSLLKTQQEMAWLYSKTRSIDDYPSDSPATEQITERLHHLSGGLVTLYMFAALEEHIEPGSPMWNAFLALLDPDDHEKLMAFKHIRNTMAHGFDGARAQRNAKEFDAVMKRPAPADRIQGVVSFDGDTIRLKHLAGWESYSFMERVVETAMRRELKQ